MNPISVYVTDQKTQTLLSHNLYSERVIDDALAQVRAQHPTHFWHKDVGVPFGDVPHYHLVGEIQKAKPITFETIYGDDYMQVIINGVNSAAQNTLGERISQAVVAWARENT